MPYMFVTEDTSHSPMGWSNAAASWNAYRMVVTDETSQPPMG